MLSIGIQRIDSTSCGFMEDSVMERENCHPQFVSGTR